MPGTTDTGRRKLPGRFVALVQMMPPQAIRDDERVACDGLAAKPHSCHRISIEVTEKMHVAIQITDRDC